MSTTALTSALTAIYAAILHEDGLTSDLADRVVAEVAERVALMYDLAEVAEFVAEVDRLVNQGGYVIDVAAVKAARAMVSDWHVDVAREGGRRRLYPEFPTSPIEDVRRRPNLNDLDPTDRRSSVRRTHHVFADYFYGTAAELAAGDGFRLLDLRGHDLTVDLERPLVVVAVETMVDLVAVSVIDRSSMVHEAMGNLPDGVAETVATLVFSDEEEVLIRY